MLEKHFDAASTLEAIFSLLVKGGDGVSAQNALQGRDQQMQQRTLSQQPSKGGLFGSAAGQRRFSAKELREWLGALLVPVMIAAVSLWFSTQQSQLAKQQGVQEQPEGCNVVGWIEKLISC